MMRIDAHQHFWNLAKVDYPWLVPEHGAIFKTFSPSDLEPHLRAEGIERTVLVQAANSLEDTVSMLTQAEAYDWIGAVVGWVPLDEPERARTLLERFSHHPKFRGVRHLIHNERDPDWLLRPPVISGLKLLAEFNLPFDVVAVYPDHLKHVPVLAEEIPCLTLIIDHLAKPPIAASTMDGWASQLQAAARHHNVYAKISGLNTAAALDWSAADLKPYIDLAVESFGADRLMFGSDWPVCLLAGDYMRVWTETNKALSDRSQQEIEAILGGTARRIYRID
jgi:L-fuconolactonase